MQTLVGAVPPVCDSGPAPRNAVSIDVDPGVSEAILGRRSWRRLLRRRGPETGGMLTGHVERGGDTLAVRIEKSVGIPCEHLFGPSYSLSGRDKEAFKQARGTDVIGFYRTHKRNGLGLDQDDRALFQEFFAETGAIALLVKPRVFRRSVATVFVWQDGAVQPDVYSPRIPARPRRRGRAPRKFPLWSSWWIQAPLLLCLLTAYGLLGYASANEVSKLTQAVSGQRDPYALSMAVLEYEDNLHLSWDRQAPPILASHGGILEIADGDQIRSLELTAAQLRTGTVAYRKISGHVRFKLEVLLNHGRSVSETWESATP